MAYPSEGLAADFPKENDTPVSTFNNRNGGWFGQED